MLELVNRERAAVGAPPLEFNGALNDSAEDHSRWILDTDNFSHTGAGGSSADQRMAAAGYVFDGSYGYGENIAFASTRAPDGLRDEVALLHADLMKSPGHKANILRSDFREIGIGVEVGTFQGRQVAVITQNFAFSASSGDVADFANTRRGVVVDLAAQKATGPEIGTVLFGPAKKTGVIGGSGNDRLTGDSAANRLDGGAGNDTLHGGAGKDRLSGGAGNDTHNGGSNADRMQGGRGNDTYVVDNSGDAVVEAAGEGSDTVQSLVTHALRSNVERLTLLGSGDIGGTGNGLANAITGNGGKNLLKGGSGNDTLNGGRNADRMEGGTGNDTCYVDNRGDRVIELAGQGTDTVRSTIGLALSANVERLTLLGSGDIGGTGNGLANVIRGNAGDNVLNGGIGNDQLLGASGDDTLRGQAGADVLEGGRGSDILNGGSGADTFRFVAIADSRPGTARDRIQDFAAADEIQIAAIDANTGLAGNQAFRFIGGRAFSDKAGELRAGAGVVQGDVNGDGIADFEIEVAGLARLTIDHFIL